MNATPQQAKTSPVREEAITSAEANSGCEASSGDREANFVEWEGEASSEEEA